MIFVLLTIYDFFEKLSPLDLLHYYIDLLISLNNLQDFDDIWMSNIFYNSHLSWNVNFIMGIDYQAFVQYFDCYFLLCWKMNAFLNGCESADPYLFA